ncbi:MAG: DUF4258 domain-containing protein [Alphaproteobacteria bacterium]|nr:DUF4258 domain-containing protein [Alphaproteobacteria bacterium]
MPPKPGFHAQLALLQEVFAQSPTVKYYVHAQDQMRDRRIARQDVRSALASGEVVSTELAYETEERWRVKGYDVDGDALIVVIEAIQSGGDTIVVVAAFPPKGRR